MPNATAFDWICGELERLTSLDTLEARGTVRLTLKEAGLEARTVTPEQLTVAVQRILGGELRARGVENADEVCGNLVTGLKGLEAASATGESPEDVFKRLGGS
jgi:hypothetical protein